MLFVIYTGIVAKINPQRYQTEKETDVAVIFTPVLAYGYKIKNKFITNSGKHTKKYRPDVSVAI